MQSIAGGFSAAYLRRRNLRCVLGRLPPLRYAGGPPLRTTAGGYRIILYVLRLASAATRRRLRRRILCCVSQEDSLLRTGAGSSAALRMRSPRCESSQDDPPLRHAGGSSVALFAATIDAHEDAFVTSPPVDCRWTPKGPGRQGARLEAWLAWARSAN